MKKNQAKKFHLLFSHLLDSKKANDEGEKSKLDDDEDDDDDDDDVNQMKEINTGGGGVAAEYSKPSTSKRMFAGMWIRFVCVE